MSRSLRGVTGLPSGALSSFKCSLFGAITALSALVTTDVDIYCSRTKPEEQLTKDLRSARKFTSRTQATQQFLHERYVCAQKTPNISVSDAIVVVKSQSNHKKGRVLLKATSRCIPCCAGTSDPDTLNS